MNHGEWSYAYRAMVMVPGKFGRNTLTSLCMKQHPRFGAACAARAGRLFAFTTYREAQREVAGYLSGLPLEIWRVAVRHPRWVRTIIHPSDLNAVTLRMLNIFWRSELPYRKPTVKVLAGADARFRCVRATAGTIAGDRIMLLSRVERFSRTRGRAMTWEALFYGEEADD